MAQLATYRMRFFFEYGGGGCLWCDNDAAFERYGFGSVDADIYGLDGKISRKASLEFVNPIRQKIDDFNILYDKSLNWNDPGGDSLWDDEEWKTFYAQTRALCKEISVFLGDEFDIIYLQEHDEFETLYKNGHAVEGFYFLHPDGT